MSTTAVRLLPAGQSSILLETDGMAETLNIVAQLRSSPPPGMIDFLPAERTVMVFARPGADLSELRAALHDMVATPPAPEGHKLPDGIVTIEVRYDGEDLDDVADILGLSVPELVTWHTGQIWRCAFIGFAPGFSYLSPEADAAPRIPRRLQSRPSVPAGAVALADRYSAVYPRSSPGGWQIIGTTDTPMWNVDNNPPALVPPGQRVRFVQAIRT